VHFIELACQRRSLPGAALRVSGHVGFALPTMAARAKVAGFPAVLVGR
jgi:hypothetical protein